MGSNLARKLFELGSHVWVTHRPSSNCWRIADIYDQLQVVRVDLAETSVEELSAELPRNVKFVFHLAAAGVRQSEVHAEYVLNTNVLGTLRLLQWAHTIELERFVFCGSCNEYGEGELQSEKQPLEPNSEYAASKAAASLLVNAYWRRYGLPTVTLRPFTVFGPWEAGYRLIPQTVLGALRGESIELTQGEQKRDFVYVKDVTNAFLKAALTPQAVGQTFNVSTGEVTSVRELVRLILKATGGRAYPLFGAIPYRDTELWVLSGDPTKARQRLGWRAEYALEDALTETIEWFQVPQHSLPYHASRRNLRE